MIFLNSWSSDAGGIPSALDVVTWTFDGPVLGLIFTEADLDATDSFLGLEIPPPTPITDYTGYFQNDNIGFMDSPADSFSSSSLNTLTVAMYTHHDSRIGILTKSFFCLA